MPVDDGLDDFSPSTPAQRLVSILSLIDQVSIDGAGAVDQMSSTDPPG